MRKDCWIGDLVRSNLRELKVAQQKDQRVQAQECPGYSWTSLRIRFISNRYDQARFLSPTTLAFFPYGSPGYQKNQPRSRKNCKTLQHP